MVVPEEHKWNFCYVMPDPPGHPIRIVVPSALQMGWAQSPALFCEATATVKEIINDLLDKGKRLPLLTLEHYFLPDGKVDTAKLATQMVQVFVDNFILAAQSTTLKDLLHISRAAIAAIESIFSTLEVSGHQNGRHSISEKKCKKGDARWAQQKIVLGFLFNGTVRTVRPPTDKLAATFQALNDMLKETRVSLLQYQKVLGKLWHAAAIAPAGLGLFTPLNQALETTGSRVGLGRKSATRVVLLELCNILAETGTRPTHVWELVRTVPLVGRYCNAAAEGASGVIFTTIARSDPWSGASCSQRMCGRPLCQMPIQQGA
eukprot:11035168-Ditylum_brightwellii.AAC.1